MMRLALPIVLLVALAALAPDSRQAHAQAGGTATVASVRQGQDYYERFGCYACHGHVGQGGGAGSRLAPHPMPLIAFRAYLRAPTGAMPPYSARVLSDAQIADIHAFLQTIEPPAARPALLRQRN